ncbi:hypothetical protein [Clostridium butyricum]
MTEELKRKIIIRAIKNYKNRPNWEDSYVEETYADAIEYMLSNFDRYFGASGSGAGSTVPQGARIKKLEQGDRSIEYEYDSTSTTTTTTSGLSALIEADVVLSVLLGLPLIRVM